MIGIPTMTDSSSRLQPYPALKPSGLPWLGEVPEHWEVRRLKSICRLAYGDSLPSQARKEGIVTVYGSNGLVGFHAVANTSGECLIIGRKGSFGKVRYSSEPAFAIDTTYFVDSRYTEANMRWLYYMLGWLQLDAVSRDSAVPGLNREDAYQRISLYPSLVEQTAIVRYLDHADSRIQRYINFRARLIELLTEQKQAVINQAITRGLDPNVHLKPSGVEWLGDVPAHWKIQRLRTLANITTGDKDTIDRQDEGRYPFFVRSQNVERIDTWTFDGEAVLTAGDGVGVGRVFHYIKGKFDYHQRVYKFSDFRSVEGRFFFYYFSSVLRFEVMQGTAKSTVDSLRLPMLQNFLVTVPPPTEQADIVEHLDKTTSDIDIAITLARRQIELMKEYRTRLIADVVTGKLDVREAVADEVEIPTP